MTAKDLRHYLIDKTSLQYFVQFQNKQIFDNIDDRYRFVICGFKNNGSTEVVRGGFSVGDTVILRDFNNKSIPIPVEVLRNYSPESLVFPYFRSKELINALAKITQYPPLGQDMDDSWFASLYMKELDRAEDSDRLVESPDRGEYPIYQGKNIYQYSYDDTVIENLASVSLWGVSEDNPDRSAKHRIRMKNFRSRDPRAGLKKAIYNEF